MFNFTKYKIDALDIYELSSSDGLSSFSVIPSLGCCLHELDLKLGNKRIGVIKNWGNKGDFKSNYLDNFIGSQLFPFPNRLENGQYYHNGKKHHFPLNDPGRNNELHGDLYTRPFEYITTNKEGNELVFQYKNLGKESAFPFEYIIKNKFLLTDSSLTIQTELKNLSSEIMPFGYGWHPYFYTPEKIDNYKFVLPPSQQLISGKNLIPTGQVEDFGKFQQSEAIKNTSFDSCFKTIKPSSILLSNAAKRYTIEVNLGNFDYFQLYTPNERGCIAIEPQSCAPNAFNNKLGLVYLKPDEKKEFEFRISLLNYRVS